MIAATAGFALDQHLDLWPYIDITLNQYRFRFLGSLPFRVHVVSYDLYN